MIRLTKIYIKGFKDPDREINFTFAPGNITVVYGKNGCGKTTFLRVLQAMISRNSTVLQRENVQTIEAHFSKNGETFVFKYDTQKLFNTPDNQAVEPLYSILFGIHRGIDAQQILSPQVASELIANVGSILTHRGVYSNELRVILKSVIRQTLFEYQSLLNKNNNSEYDFISIKSIEKVISEYFQEGKRQAVEKASNAFFETIESFEKQLGSDYELDAAISNRISAKKDFIQDALEAQNKSSLKEKLETYLDTLDASLLDTKISRALILNILQKAEEPNPELDAITELLHIFNGHLSYGKRLVVTKTEVYIDLGQGKRHDLDELSSGERNLLSLLTMFLITGRQSHFLMIDEPENSLNLDWQETFLQTISRLNPQAQIIVATHSPAIAPSPECLVELV